MGQRDMVDEECNKLQEQLQSTKQKLDEMTKENLSVKTALQRMKEQTPSIQEHEVARMRKEMEAQVARLKEDLGNKNIELASIQVDVERGELKFKKKCDILQADLDYEKSHNVRLTQEIRRIQSQAAMDTTSYGLGSKSSALQSREPAQASSSSSASTNTSV